MGLALFGLETEYAITGWKGNKVQSRSVLATALLEAAHKRLASLADLHSSGVYLQNGSRLYIDCGLHPEISTPECANPWDAVRYVRAGERILQGLLAEVQAKGNTYSEVMCFRCNVDYGGTGATWGCHESYLHRADPLALAARVIPHLVTRVVYSGAGGFNPMAPGLAFTLSPRVAHLVQVISNSSTGMRGIFHTKDEPLCGTGHHRLHILTGESLCSDLALFVKVGATALVVAMIDAGLPVGEAVALDEPLRAIRTVAADPTCQARLRLKDGAEATATGIQRHYLEFAEQHLGRDFMPPWAGEVCRHWRATLDLVQDNLPEAMPVLDWLLKQALYRDQARRKGIDWDSLSECSEALARLNSGEGIAERVQSVEALDRVLSLTGPSDPAIRRASQYLKAKRLTWDAVRAALSVRGEFFQIDTRFAQLGPSGIFGMLDASGVLRHRVPGVDNISHAVENPPSSGRARLRGEAIRRLAAERDQWGCHWEEIVNRRDGRWLDLTDPFAEQERWQQAAFPAEGLYEAPEFARFQPGSRLARFLSGDFRL
jgi:proteasome accessory factor A